MKKKVLCFFIALLMLVLPTSAFAATEETDDYIIGYLTDENGNQIEVIGTLVDTAVQNNTRSGSDEVALTYEFDFLVANNGEYDVELPEETDPGYASTVNATLYYKISSDGNGALLTGALAEWVVSDPNTVVASAYVNCTCRGIPADNNSDEAFIDQNSTFFLLNGRRINTNYSDYVNLRNGFDSFTDVAASFEFYYRMGSRTWSLTFGYELF